MSFQENIIIFAINYYNNIHYFKILSTMKTLGYLFAFIGGAITGAAVGLLAAPEKGEDTRNKISNAVDDFCKKHDIRLSRKETDEFVEDIKEAASNIAE